VRGTTPDMQEDARADAGNRGVGVVLDDRAPAVGFHLAGHVLGARPIWCDRSPVDDAVIKARGDVVHALDGRREGRVVELEAGQRLGRCAEGRAEREDSGRGFAVALFLDRVRWAGHSRVFDCREPSAPAHPVLAYDNGDGAADGLPMLAGRCALIALQPAVDGGPVLRGHDDQLRRCEQRLRRMGGQQCRADHEKEAGDESTFHGLSAHGYALPGN